MFRTRAAALVLIICGFLCLSQTGLSQTSGNIGYSQSSGSSRAKQNERNKRVPLPVELPPADGTFIEASVLMNVPADEYVAVFGVSAECVTVPECSQKIDATISEFSTAAQQLGIAGKEINIDFVAQNRTYAYRIVGDVAKEELAGFEVKKNVALHYKDKLLLDKLIIAASRSKIFDLIKVDYIVREQAAVQNRLIEEAARIIKQKAARYEQLLGVKLLPPIQVYAEKPNIYFPTEMYDSYVAQESESVSQNYSGRDKYTVQGARKSRTMFFNPLNADGFDLAINPVIVEPVVQFTLYLKIRYSGEGKATKP